jgi:hypothetical protein
MKRIGLPHIITVVALSGLVFLALACGTMKPSRMTVKEFVSNIDNEKTISLIQSFITNNSLVGKKYYCCDEDTSGFKVVVSPEKYGNIYTLKNIETTSETTNVIFHFVDQSDKEKIVEIEVGILIKFPKDTVKSSFTLDYDTRTKTWLAYNEFQPHKKRQTRLYPVDKDFYSIDDLNKWSTYEITKDNLPFAQLKTYVQQLKKDIFYEYSSLEWIINESKTDKKYGTEYTSYIINDLKVGAIYRLLCPVSYFGQINSNMMIARIIERSSNIGLPDWGDWSDEIVFEEKKNFDSTNLPVVTVPHWVTRMGYESNEISGKIGYIVRFDGSTQVITQAGFIRVVPKFTVIGTNQYSYYDGNLLQINK